MNKTGKKMSEWGYDKMLAYQCFCLCFDSLLIASEQNVLGMKNDCHRTVWWQWHYRITLDNGEKLLVKGT